jgi:selenide,water dikinase
MSHSHQALGVGIINTAVKAGLAQQGSPTESHMSMTTLNKRYEAARDKDVHAATDITGFSCSVMLMRWQLPAMSPSSSMRKKSGDRGSAEYASMGLNRGLYNNVSLWRFCSVRGEMEQSRMTSSMIHRLRRTALSMSKADGLLYSQETGFSIIGEVVEKTESPLLVV